MRLLTTIVFLVSVSCSLKSKNSGTKIENEKGLDSKEVKTDTLVTKGDEVLFFKPTKEEFENLKKEKGDNFGLDEVESDFNYYATKIQDKLKESKVVVKYPKGRVIKIIAFDNSVSYLDRIGNGTNIYGVIINSSVSEPTVLFGVNTDLDILKNAGIK